MGTGGMGTREHGDTGTEHGGYRSTGTGHGDMDGHVTQDMRGHGTRDTGTWGDTTHGCTCMDTHGVSCTHTYMRTHTWTRVHTHTDTRLHACSGLLPHPHGGPSVCPAGLRHGGKVLLEGPHPEGLQCEEVPDMGGLRCRRGTPPSPRGSPGVRIAPAPRIRPISRAAKPLEGCRQMLAPSSHLGRGGGGVGGTYNNGAFSASYRLRFILVIPRGTVAPVLKAAAHTGRPHFRSFVRVQSIVSPSVPVTGSRPRHGDGL